MASREQLENALRAADAAGNTDDARILAGELKRLSQPEAKASTMPPPIEEPSTGGFIGGNLAKGVAGLLGIPMDVAGDIANLGIAGYGTTKGLMGGKNLPELLPPFPGGSESITNLMRKGGMIGPSAEPESTGGRYAAAALQAAPSLLAGRPNLRQLPRALTGAVTSGVGGQLGADIAPEGYEAVGAQVGAMAPGAKRFMHAPTTGETATKERQAQRFAQAKELGLPVPPREMKADKPQQKIQDAINKELGRKEGDEISRQTLDPYIADKYQTGYVPVINEPALNGMITVDPKSPFKQAVQNIAREERALRQEFPNSVKDVGLQNMLVDFIKPSYSTQGAMSMIKRLREGARNNFSEGGDDKIRTALVQKKLAGALEDLVEENLTRVGKPELVKNFRDSRKQMAQAFATIDALDPRTGKVNPAVYSKMLTEGEPLTGDFKTIAQVSQAFPTAAKEPRMSEELFTKRVTPMAIAHPPAMATHWLSRLGHPIAMSEPYQSMFVDPRAKLSPDQERFMRMLIGLQQQQGQQQPVQ